MSGHRCTNCNAPCDCEPHAGGCAWCSECLSGTEPRQIMESLERERAARAKRLPDDEACLRAMMDGFVRLKELGWREAIYAPADNSSMLVIEAGSTGIHMAYRDKERRFWVVQAGDTWPSDPILWRPAAAAPQTQGTEGANG